MVKPVTGRGAFRSLACFLATCAFLAGCAAPGDPTPRHPIVPAAVTDLAARQSGDSVALTFTLPTRSMDKELLEEPPTIEVYRAEIPAGAAPDRKTAWRLADTIPSERADSYLKGEKIEFRDPLAPGDFGRGAGTRVAYRIRTRAVSARGSQFSNVSVATIYPAPEAPRGLRVTATESALIVNWEEAAIPAGAASRTYRVYRGEVEPGQITEGPDVSALLQKTPLQLLGPAGATEFRDTHFEFGKTYLYTVRAVAQFVEDLAESADSAPVIVAPRDIFPPAAPTGLEIAVLPAAPQTPAYVELSWAISPESDLAGYLVYRSDTEGTAGERVNSEILPSPTFRDMSVLPGRRYYYRVTAVDRSGNESPKSPPSSVDVP